MVDVAAAVRAGDGLRACNHIHSRREGATVARSSHALSRISRCLVRALDIGVIWIAGTAYSVWMTPVRQVAETLRQRSLG
jgi:hypothetical protein